MQNPQKARLETLQRIQWFMDRNAEVLGMVNKSRTRLALDAIVPVLEGHAADQHNAAVEARSKTEIKKELRHDLRVHHMQPIAAIAKARLSGVADTPLMAKLQYPPASLDDKALVAAGQSMAQAAQQYYSVFVDEQLPAGFLTELHDATTALRNATADRDGSQLRVRAATAGLATQFTRAAEIVRVLNTLVVKQLKGREDLLVAWTSAKRVRQKSGVTRTAEQLTPISNPPGTAVVTAPSAPPAAVVMDEGIRQAA